MFDSGVSVLSIVLAAVAVVLTVIVIAQIRRIMRLNGESLSLKSRLDAQEAASRERLDAQERSFKDRLDAQEKAAAERLAAQEKASAERLEAQEKLYNERLTAQADAQKLMKEQNEKDLQNMKDAFKALSAENSEAFRRSSTEGIALMLKPIQEKFQDFDKSVKESQQKSGEQNASMRTLIEQVMQQSRTVGEEARNLANALTGYSKVQGDFGEMLLADVLKNAGLVEGVHFITQGVITDSYGHEVKSETGATMIPDVMVLYPDDTTVIIDSKVSLKSYNMYMNATEAENRRHFAREHVDSVRKHVDELKRKDYASYIPDGKSKVAYNIMFIPMEGAFRLMLEEDPMLWQLAKDNNVLIVSQMTLVIVLNMIQMSWRQHDQEKNIAEVYNTASELMGQLESWMGAYVKIGNCLEDAGKAYKEAKDRLSDGRQSVVQKIDKLEKLGLSPKRSNARLKTGSRMSVGRESIIPKELSEQIDNN